MRIDVYLFKNGLCKSREEAQKLIKAKCVNVNGMVVNKPSFSVDDGVINVEVKNPFKYVSRGGDKLQAALDNFKIDPTGAVCCDIGASTGGFTDCLLQYGAARVYAVDSGTAQLSEKLKNDPRIISMENTNARYIKDGDIPEKCDICVMDVSFISQTLLYDSVNAILKDGGLFISLIKPQFEVGRNNLSKGGIVKNDKIRLSALEKIISSAKTKNLVLSEHMLSPIKGGDGNTEYLALFIKEIKDTEF